MLQRSIREYGRLRRAELGGRLCRELQRFDELHAGLKGQTVFDWGHLADIRAKSFVGVIQIPGLVVEILPKIDDQEVPLLEPSTGQLPSDIQIRKNLLFMLSVTGQLLTLDRDLASQSLQKHSMLETLIASFAQKLLKELRLGQQHQYIRQEKNLPFVKGKLLLRQHLLKNTALQHRVYVEFDDFINDTWLNRILKAACLRLLAVTRLPKTQQYLREAILELADVKDVAIEQHHFEQVQLERTSERFRSLLNFCRLVFDGSSPSSHHGRAKTFSLLFPMDTVFESFIGGILTRYASEFGLKRSEVHVQAKNRAKWLLRQDDNKGRFRLRPDILIDGANGRPAVIVDTKWKRLVDNSENATNGVSQADIYQLYAYAHRFDCSQNILLYPEAAFICPRTYQLDGDSSGKMLRIALIDLNYDLRANVSRFLADLKAVLAFS